MRCLVRVVEHILTTGHAKIEYVDLCELCESRHQVGETVNTEHGWIPVERLDDFHEILVDNSPRRPVLTVD